MLWQQGKVIRRRGDDVLPKDNPELMQLAKDQLTELLTNYGAIDAIFFDGDATGIREHAWSLQPNIVVTRGSLKTPEQQLPEVVDGVVQADNDEPTMKPLHRTVGSLFHHGSSVAVPCPP